MILVNVILLFKTTFKDVVFYFMEIICRISDSFYLVESNENIKISTADKLKNYFG